jgi:hypothetical protein
MDKIEEDMRKNMSEIQQQRHCSRATAAMNRHRIKRARSQCLERYQIHVSEFRSIIVGRAKKK